MPAGERSLPVIVGLVRWRWPGGGNCEQRLVVTFGEWQKQKGGPGKGQKKQLGLWSGALGGLGRFWNREEAHDHH